MKRIFNYIIAATMVFGLLSCQDELDIEQKGAISLEEYYGSDKSAEGAVTAIYTELRGMQFNYKFLKNICSDDVWAGGADRGDNNDLEKMNEYTYSAEHSFLSGCFQGYYNIIYNANIVLQYITPDSDFKKQMIAEAKVFRAFAYIDLISMWGTPPLVDHLLNPSEYQKPNGNVNELWELVETDLSEAIESDDLVEKSELEDRSVFRVTRQFAQALLGKAYLYQKKYTESAAAFEEVINSQLYNLYQGDYDEILAYNNKNNSESMFELNRVVDEKNESNNFDIFHLMVNWRTDRFTTTPVTLLGISDVGWGFCAPQKGLYDAFTQAEGENGYRLNLTLKTYEQLQNMGVNLDAGKTIINEGYFFWKNRITKDEVSNMWFWNANFIIMRYADVLLMASEANLNGGNQGKADTYLNSVRNRAQLANVTATMDAIKLERRLELCFEDVRFQDLIRWGDAITLLAKQGETYPVMASNGIVTYKSTGNTEGKFGFQERNYLFPFPSTEIQLNKSILQNNGW
jgi:tetratricopeptide (TPR) repeat protein